MAGNPPIQEKVLDFITPDMDVKRLVNVFARIIKKQEAKTKENKFEGTLQYRVIGNKMTKTTFSSREKATVLVTDLDITHVVADPFRDSDIDSERINSKGMIDRDVFEKRRVLYVQNNEMAQMLYLAEKEEDRPNLATFLLRIVSTTDENVLLEKGDKIVFGFRDLEGMRGPFIIPTEEKNQKTNTSAAAKPGSKKKQTSTECKEPCEDK